MSKKPSIPGINWKKGFQFEVKYSKRGIARIYVNGNKTKFLASRWAYNKESYVIAEMINDLAWGQNYNGMRWLDYNADFAEIKAIFESLEGNKLNKLGDSNFYEICFDGCDLRYR